MISYVPTMLQDFEVKQEVLKKKKKKYKEETRTELMTRVKLSQKHCQEESVYSE